MYATIAPTMSPRWIESPPLLLGLALASCVAEPVDPPAQLETSPRSSTPKFMTATQGPADEVIRAALQNATQEGQRLVVYTGASWCEPCMDFHHAVERGELDDALSGIRLIEFDSDRDGARLRDAGYGGRYIPRFVLPNEDGRGSDRRIEGGIKGPGAVANIMQRLGPLLSQSKAR